MLLHAIWWWVRVPWLRAGVEIVVELTLEAFVEFVSEEHGDVFGLDGMHSGAHDRLVKGLEDGLLSEHHIAGVFRLHEAPVAAAVEVLEHRAESLDPAIEVPVQRHGVEPIGDRLDPSGLGDPQEGAIGNLEDDAGLAQLLGQPGMSVEVNLEAKRRPSGHARVGQAEVLVDEVEVVVQALTRVGLELNTMGGLVVPGVERRAKLHGREDTNQPRLGAALGEDCQDAFHFSKCLVPTVVLHGDTGLAGEALGAGSQLITQRLGPTRVAGEADLLVCEARGHGPGMSDRGQVSGDHYPVDTSQDPGNLPLVAGDKGVHAGSSSLVDLSSTIGRGFLFWFRRRRVGIKVPNGASVVSLSAFDEFTKGSSVNC